jgi:Zn-dependent peptidase ImmA (M78 family)
MPDVDMFRIQQLAHESLKQLAINKPEEIDIEVLAFLHGAPVLYEALQIAEGMLVRRGNRALIYVDQRSGNPGRIRFAIAHEIGHLVLHAGESQAWLWQDTAASLIDYHNSVQEIEANLFAANLLMPTRLFGPDVQQTAFCIAGIKYLAAKYQVSLTAAARRFVDESRDNLMLVFSENGRVNWWHRTINVPGFYLRANMNVPADSDAADCSQGLPGKQDLMEVEPHIWFTELHGHKVLEQSLKLGNFPWVLTLIQAEEQDGDLEF